MLTGTVESIAPEVDAASRMISRWRAWMRPRSRPRSIPGGWCGVLVGMGGQASEATASEVMK